LGPSAFYGDLIRLTDSEVEGLIDDDLHFGDLTTRALGVGEQRGRMDFFARQPLILCGVEEAARLLSRLGVEVSFAGQTGQRAAKGELVLAAQGSAAALHAGWKVAQTVMEWASGVASLTHDIVAAAREIAPHIVVLCTRKSVPWTRKLSLKAVLAGGGECHRLGLSDSIMLFPEHRVFWAPPGDLKSAIGRLKERAPERTIMVEVNSESEALEAAEAMADVIQLEKFAPAAVMNVTQRVRKRADGRPIIAAAGGINVQNAGDYARSGADTLVTSAPFYARPLDIQVNIDPL
jgi:molybdenum transport protein